MTASHYCQAWSKSAAAWPSIFFFSSFSLHCTFFVCFFLFLYFCWFFFFRFLLLLPLSLHLNFCFLHTFIFLYLPLSPYVFLCISIFLAISVCQGFTFCWHLHLLYVVAGHAQLLWRITTWRVFWFFFTVKQITFEINKPSDPWGLLYFFYYV